MSNSTSFLLLYPPVADPYSPCLSLPELLAVLNDNGYECQCLDLNVLAHEKLLTDKTFSDALKKNLSGALSTQKSRFKINKSFNENQEICILRVTGPFLSARLDKAKQMFPYCSPEEADHLLGCVL